MIYFLETAQQEKLLQLAKNILKLFGSEADLDDVVVVSNSDNKLVCVLIFYILNFKLITLYFKMKQISNKYPSVKITLTNYENLVSLLKNDGEFKYSQVIRPLVYGILVDEKDWENSNKLFSKYSDEFGAILGKVIS